MENKNIKEIKNEINEGLTFGLLKGKALAFVNQEITQEQFDSWSKDISIITSLPMSVKISVLIDLTTKYFYSNMEHQEFLVGELYRNLFFSLYLRYLGVIDVFEEENNFENYDLMEPIYGPWIELVAGRDIQKFKNMLQDCLNLYASSTIADAMEKINTESIQQAMEDNKKMLEELEKKKDLVRHLKEIAVFNNPNLTQLVNQMEKEITTTENREIL